MQKELLCQKYGSAKFVGCCWACRKRSISESLALLQDKESRLPRAHNEEDALKLVELAEKINEAAKDKAEIDADIVKRVSYTAAGELSPMAATLGGIVGQEVGQPQCCAILMLLWWQAQAAVNASGLVFLQECSWLSLHQLQILVS